jgi:hypothetical protein
MNFHWLQGLINDSGINALLMLNQGALRLFKALQVTRRREK